MKIRTLMDLESALDTDLAWRRREFTTLKFMVESAREHEKKILIKASIALLYAHWEGHIKLCSSAYLMYLKHKAPKYRDMTDNFVQMSLGDKFNSGFSIKKFSSQKDIYEYICGELDNKFDIDPKVVIDTESNLKYKVLSNIISQLGLDCKFYELKENFIDSKLIECRNAVAHGEKRDDVELLEAYNELQKELLDMISTFNDMVKDAAQNKVYLNKVA